MGYKEFRIEATGYSPSEAFDNAVNTAQNVYGTSGTTGTIAEKRDFLVIANTNNENVYSLAELLIRTRDGRIYSVDCPAGCLVINDGRDGSDTASSTKVNQHLFKGARAWETFYVGYSTIGGNKERFVATMKGDAITKARDISLKECIPITIVLQKRLTGSSPIVTIVEPQGIRNTRVLGKYLFFGIAHN